MAALTAAATEFLTLGQMMEAGMLDPRPSAPNCFHTGAS